MAMCLYSALRTGGTTGTGGNVICATLFNRVLEVVCRVLLCLLGVLEILELSV